ncbi:hypothetical protein [Hymenobacter metallicola]|uniref:Uncharacterized protein n=1 Tax=Hymenobacter metallicola TaxID=2563114 RepID=A0A4Z0QLI3_9BACT|nr:hypothetical protein [Hymenobacter metallicola]TGE29592.1 hypothetical protein E5K02_09105 [Hymenobacter metallicola]
MLLSCPFLLLGDITGLIWMLGIGLALVFLGFLVAVLLVGKRDFVDRADTAEGKSGRLGLLIIGAPFLALLLLYLLLAGL